MNTIVLATDGSPSAAQAAGMAFELARTTGWTLRIVTVWAVEAAAFGLAPVAGYTPEIFEGERAQAGTVLDEAVEAAHAAGLEPVAELRRGRPVDEICVAAEECDATLIVLGAHGRGPVKRLIFGSVSTGVLHHAHCPVLVVPGQVAAAEPQPVGSGAALAGG